MKKFIISGLFLVMTFLLWSCDDLIRDVIDQNMNGYTAATIEVNQKLIKAKVDAEKAVISSKADALVKKESASTLLSQAFYYIAILVLAILGTSLSFVVGAYAFEYTFHRYFNTLERSHSARVTVKAYKEIEFENATLKELEVQDDFLNGHDLKRIG